MFNKRKKEIIKLNDRIYNLERMVMILDNNYSRVKRLLNNIRFYGSEIKRLKEGKNEFCLYDNERSRLIREYSKKISEINAELNAIGREYVYYNCDNENNK
jgi:hypothetical protein